MSKGFKIDVKGLDAWGDAGQVVFDAVKDCMDDIRDDVSEVSESLTPYKTGKLESSQYVRRYYKNLQKCYFTISYKGENKGFDYATWTHDEKYNLGEGSRAKRPARSRFAKGTLTVGTGYVSQIQEASEDNWARFISTNIGKKLKASLKKGSKKSRKR